MNNEEMKKFVSDVSEKLGKDNSALISDDLATLLTDNSKLNLSLENKDKEIEKLKEDKDKFATANANLLQQVSVAEDYITKPNQEETKKEPFNFKSAFDEKGNFKK